MYPSERLAGEPRLDRDEPCLEVALEKTNSWP
jgi:hypothetical protein